jgi:hypothetical protein
MAKVFVDIIPFSVYIAAYRFDFIRQTVCYKHFRWVFLAHVVLVWKEELPWKWKQIRKTSKPVPLVSRS